MCEIIEFVCEQVVKGSNVLVCKVSMCDRLFFPIVHMYTSETRT